MANQSITYDRDHSRYAIVIINKGQGQIKDKSVASKYDL